MRFVTCFLLVGLVLATGVFADRGDATKQAAPRSSQASSTTGCRNRRKEGGL